jgi:hypothetical protein
VARHQGKLASPGAREQGLHTRANARWHAALWLAVALQIAIPASYYVRAARGTQAAPDDERFAWRMFSGIRLKRCSVSARGVSRASLGRGSARFAEATEPLAVSGALHGSWVHSLERGRRRVIERFLASRCALQGASFARVELMRNCRDVTSRPEAPEVYRYDCAQGTLSGPDAASSR